MSFWDEYYADHPEELKARSSVQNTKAEITQKPKGLYIPESFNKSQVVNLAAVREEVKKLPKETRINTRLSNEEEQFAEKLGNGNASLGMRIVLMLARDLIK